MADENFVLEKGASGTTLVITGSWSKGARDALARGVADGLVMNYARGFVARDLDFVDGDWQLRRLSLLDRSITDLAPIERLGASLENLSVQAAPSANLDLSAFPKLQAVAGEWALIGGTLGTASLLRSVSTWAFGDEDLHAFRDHVELELLTIKHAPYLRSLSGVSGLNNLEQLSVVGASALGDISDLRWLPSLQELTLEECHAISSIEDVQTLDGLRFLSVSECGDIASLAPIRALQQLETFYAWGSTRVLDSDLSPLTALPTLKEIRIRNRRSYEPPATSLAATVY